LSVSGTDHYKILLNSKHLEYIYVNAKLIDAD
jgi:hypothetical protein